MLKVLFLTLVGVLVLGAPPAMHAQEPVFGRGDADGNGVLELTDSIRLLAWQFLGGPAPPCLDAADANDSGSIDLSDPVFILIHLFVGSVAIPPPGRPDSQSCGPDPTPDALDCGTIPSYCNVSEPDAVAAAIAEAFERVVPPLVGLEQWAEDSGYADFAGHLLKMVQAAGDLITAAKAGETARALELVEAFRALTDQIINKDLPGAVHAEMLAAMSASSELTRMAQLFLRPEAVVSAFIDDLELLHSLAGDEEATLLASVDAWWESGPAQDPAGYFRMGAGQAAAELAREAAAHFEGGFQLYATSALSLWSCDDDAACAEKEVGKKFDCADVDPTISASKLNPKDEGSLKLAALVLARTEGKEDVVKEALAAIEKLAKELVEKSHRVYVYVKVKCFCCAERYCCFWTGTYKSHESVVTDWLNVHPVEGGDRDWVKIEDYSDAKDLAEKAAKRVADRVAEEVGKACP